MRVHDLFVTDYEYKLISDIEKTYININDENYASNIASKQPVENLHIEEQTMTEMAF